MITVTVSDTALEKLHPRETDRNITHVSVYQREGIFFRSYVQLNIWCSEHCHGAWFREKNTSTYAFELKSDAIMFKLAFGG